MACQLQDRQAPRVFALNGRQPVIDAAITHNHQTRRALFLIDGDLEWVRGIPAPAIVGLHRHDAYCIENLLLCEKAISQVLSEDAALTIDDALQRLKYEDWIRSIEEPLVELFSAFATTNCFSPAEKTVAQGVGILCEKDPVTKVTSLSFPKVSDAKGRALDAAIAMADEASVRAYYSDTLARLKKLPFPLHAVSGKDFMFPLLNFLLSKLRCRIRTKSLRIRLAINGEVSRFAPLYDALENAARGYK